jgi:hypothetical protein
MPTLCNEGRTNIGDVYLKAVAKSSYYLGLYKNTTEPAKDKVMTDITEADTPGQHGYARVQLLDADWTEQATPGVFKNLQKTFTASGAAWGASMAISSRRPQPERRESWSRQRIFPMDLTRSTTVGPRK